MISIAVSVAAGCGGGDTTSYAIDPTAECLASLPDVELDPDRSNVDYIAADADGGALRLQASGVEAILSFARDTKQAEGINESYSEFPGVLLVLKGNVVIAWTDEPSDDNADAVAGCLSS